MFTHSKEKSKQTTKGAVQKQEARSAAAPLNLTGIPDVMKTRFENLSGFSFDDVRVHYNSDKPAQLQALAYTQGNSVYIGPGQEKHLGHELGHVVQQKRVEVRPTFTLMNSKVNDSDSLEHKADMLSAYAMRNNLTPAENLIDAAPYDDLIQRQVEFARGPELVSTMVSWETGRVDMAEKYKDIELMLGRIAEGYFDPMHETKVIIDLIPERNARITAPKAGEKDLILMHPNEVRIEIGRELILNLSTGNLLALINHEFNVHHLANYALWGEGLDKEAKGKDISMPLNTEIDHDVKPSHDSQPDHVYAAQKPKDSKRALHYITKTTEAVKCMIKNPVKTAEAKKAEAKDSKDTFSFASPWSKIYQADWGRTTNMISDYISFYLFDVMRIHWENATQRRDDFTDLYEDAQKRLSTIINGVKDDTSIDPASKGNVFKKNELERKCKTKLDEYYEKYIESGLGAKAVIEAKKIPALQPL